MQGVDEHFVLFDVFLDLRQGPVGQRIDLDQGRVVGVFADFGKIRTGDALFAADAGDPRVQFRQRTLEGFHFADGATFLPVLQTFLERVKPFFPLQPFHRFTVGEVGSNGDSVMTAHPVHGLVGFFREASGIQSEHREPVGNPGSHVNEDHVFHSKT